MIQQWDNAQDWDKLSADKKIDKESWRVWQERLLELVLKDQETQKMKTGGEILDQSEAEKRRHLLNLIKDIQEIPSIHHAQLVNQFLDDSYRFGPLQPLWDKPYVSDIQAFIPYDSSHDQIISYTERDRKHWTATEFASFDAARDWVNKHLARIGLRYDPSKVTLDGMLPNGERINIISGPAGYSLYDPIKGQYKFVRCMIITIRRFINAFTIDELTEKSRSQHQAIEFDVRKVVTSETAINFERKPVYTQFTGSGIADRATMDYLRVVNVLKCNYLVSGGTGSGKTTVANAFCSMMDPREVLCVIEESPEMQPQTEGHVIRMYERKGVFEQVDALKNALRMFPDRLFIAELRDHIAYTFLHAIQSGHDGSSSTIHASSCAGAYDRTVELAASHPSRPNRDMIKSILNERLHTIIHCNRESGDRMIDEVCQVKKDGSLHTVSRFVQVGRDSNGKPVGYFEFLGPTDDFVRQMMRNGIDIPPSWKWRKTS